MTSITMPHIDISEHAIDRASERCLDIWEETALPGEGILTWLRRTAAETVESAGGQGSPEEDGKCIFLGQRVRYVMKQTSRKRFVLVTVTPKKNKDPMQPPDLAIGSQFLDWVAAAVQSGQLAFGKDSNAQKLPDGILLRYPALFGDFGRIHGYPAKLVKDSFLLLRLHALDPRGFAIHRRKTGNGYTTGFRGILVRDAVAALLGEARPCGPMDGPRDGLPQDLPPLHLTARRQAGGELVLMKDGQPVHGIPEEWLGTILPDITQPVEQALTNPAADPSLALPDVDWDGADRPAALAFPGRAAAAVRRAALGWLLSLARPASADKQNPPQFIPTPAPDTATRPWPPRLPQTIGIPAADSQLPIPEPSGVQTQTKPTSSPGEAFLDWIKAGVASGSIPCNRPDARVHVVAEGVLLASPAIFKDYANTVGADLEEIQRSFLRLKLHSRTAAGLNIHTYWLVGHGSTLSGVLLPNPGEVFGDAEVPQPNPLLERFGPTEKTAHAPTPGKQTMPSNLPTAQAQKTPLLPQGIELPAVAAQPETGVETRPTIRLEAPLTDCPLPAVSPGRAFLDWIAAGLASGEIACNQPQARVHVVPEGVLLASPGIFQDYAKSTGLDIWKTQDSFRKLKLHKLTGAGNSIHKYALRGRGSPLYGVLLPNPATAFGDGEVPQASPLYWLPPTKKAKKAKKATRGQAPGKQAISGSLPYARPQNPPAIEAVETPAPVQDLPVDPQTETSAEPVARQAGGSESEPVRELEITSEQLAKVFESILKRRHMEIRHSNRKRMGKAHPFAEMDAKVLACLYRKAGLPAAHKPAEACVLTVAEDTRLTAQAVAEAIKRLRSYGLINWEAWGTGNDKPIRFVFLIQSILRLARQEKKAYATLIKGQPTPPQPDKRTKADPLLSPRLKRDWQGLRVRLLADVQATSLGPQKTIPAGSWMVVAGFRRDRIGGFDLRRGGEYLCGVPASKMEIIHPQPLQDKPAKSLKKPGGQAKPQETMLPGSQSPPPELRAAMVEVLGVDPWSS